MAKGEPTINVRLQVDEDLLRDLQLRLMAFNTQYV